MTSLTIALTAGGVGCHGRARPVDERDASTEADGATAPPDAATVSCTLPSIGANLNRSWDLNVASVSGTITLNGAPVPDSPTLTTRGYVVFRDRATGAEMVFATPATGAASFSGKLLAATYDVSFQASQDSALVGLPAQVRPRLATALMIAGSRQLDFDLRLVPIGGTVTVGGAPMPDSPQAPSRGSVVFREVQSGDIRSFLVGATGPGSFSGSLFPGTYDVTFESALSTMLVGLPRFGRARVESGLVVGGTADGPPARSYDVQVATVSGKVTVNGVTMPDSPGVALRGQLILRQPSSGAVHLFSVPATGAFSYSELVFAGNYDVSFKTPNDFSLVGLPRNSTTQLATAVPVRGAVTLDHDLRTVAVSGTITSGGAPLVDSSNGGTRGIVDFTDHKNAGIASAFLGPTGPATFSLLLFSGSYDITFGAGTDVSNPGLQGGASLRIATAKRIDSSANSALSFDLQAVPVSGTVTAMGAELPSSPTLASRGSVFFFNHGAIGGASMVVGSSGPGSFSGKVFPGKYDVLFTTESGPGLVGLPERATVQLASNVTVNRNGAPAAWIWDVGIVSATGTITLDGAQLPDTPGLDSRGLVTLWDKLTGSGRQFTLSGAGPATFSGMLFAGSYDVTLDTSDDQRLVGLPIRAHADLDIGCAPSVTCDQDPADISADWVFSSRQSAPWAGLQASLVQTGADLGGRFISNRGFFSTFDSGMRTGNTIHLVTTTSFNNCVLTLDATLVGGCTLVGIGRCQGRSTTGLNNFQQAPFLGIR